ncbi:uncharacterized protein LOC106671268 [Cimex lectularius]|uniref:Uncharacterized protein n=1 Tax=Cimex lectularius TaxID=79782 RepID=A0A8I6SRZ5_CIMLE|nr:uncharacterized protein LOC106671268 [Cimex lectularius]XP_024084203.1 uncharacterized protein LOC106671268 [Cimex lectularius]
MIRYITRFSIIALHLLLVEVQCEHAETDESFTFEEFKRHPRETNVVNFVRLLVMRLIYGFAQMLGFGESISEVGDGIFVPPGADDYYFDGDDDFKDDGDYY